MRKENVSKGFGYVIQTTRVPPSLARFLRKRWDSTALALLGFFSSGLFPPERL